MPTPPTPPALSLKPSARRRWDAYDTPPWQVDALVDHVPAITGHVWEPCVGDGSLLARLAERVPSVGPVLTMDLNPAITVSHPLVEAHYTADMKDEMTWDTLALAYGAPQWVVTNPPFGDAFEILQCALKYATVGVAMILRVSFAEPTRHRGPWLKAHPHDQRIVLERWSYSGNSRSDAATTEWLIWAKDWKILTPPFGISAFGYKPRSLPPTPESDTP